MSIIVLCVLTALAVALATLRFHWFTAALALLFSIWLIASSTESTKTEHDEILEVKNFGLSNEPREQYVTPTSNKSGININRELGLSFPPKSKVKRIVYRKWYFGIYYSIPDKYELEKTSR